MQSFPPDPDSLDLAWGLEDGEEDPDSTRLVDSRELFARAGFEMDEPTVVPSSEDGANRDGASDARITLPPPLPENEYVARMMDLPSGSSQEIPSVPRPASPWDSPRIPGGMEGTLGTLLGEQPMTLECDEPGMISSRGSRRDLTMPISETAEMLIDELSEEPSSRPPPSIDTLLALNPRIPASRAYGSSSIADAGALPKPEVIPSLDFPLDLGFEEPDVSADELQPITPPPGTLRYGLLEDDLALEAQMIPGSTTITPLPPPEIPVRRESLRTLPSPPFPGRSSGKPEAFSGSKHSKLQLRFEGGDYSGALVLAEALLDEDPNDEAARRYADSCNERLRQMYRARIGDGRQVLRILVSKEELCSLNLDHRAGFLLSCVDGTSSIDEILDVSGMPELEALRLLYELIQAEVVRGVLRR